MRNRFISFGLLPAIALFATGVARAVEPPNISTAKAAVMHYVDGGEYARDLARVSEQARAWIEQRVTERREGERLAIVLDVDETAISNLAHMRAMDFGYVPAKWHDWVVAANAPAIEPVREIFELARRRGVEVFFITGRLMSDRANTERNLEAAGYGGYGQLICQPDNSKRNTGTFKREIREQLVTEGWTLIANIGDEESDFTGGGAEKGFKLPNPFYLIE